MLKKISSCNLSLWIGLVLLAIANSACAEPQAPLAVEPKNQSSGEAFSNNFNNGGLFHLFERQSNCYSPNKYCYTYNKCCLSSDLGCCPDGCYTNTVAECCNVGGACYTGKECCNTGCMPAGAECCKSGGYCPKPFLCVIYDGVPGCCTDLTCRVYLSSGVTKTATQTAASSFLGATSQRATTSYSSYTSAAYTSAGGGYTIYRTVYYWSYWYYYYTIFYFPNTYTTRTYTTITRTTSLSCSATDTYAAALIFRSSSSNLPTPASAQVTIPPTPTSGATVLGRCTSTSTSTSVDSDGYTSRSYIPICDTSIADGRGVYSTANSDGPTASSTPSSGVRIGSARMETVPWIPFIVAPLFVFGAMIAL